MSDSVLCGFITKEVNYWTYFPETWWKDEARAENL